MSLRLQQQWPTKVSETECGGMIGTPVYVEHDFKKQCGRVVNAERSESGIAVVEIEFDDTPEGRKAYAQQLPGFSVGGRPKIEEL